VILLHDSQRLPATTAATPGASTTATAEAYATATEAITSKAPTATIEAAAAETSTARSHAGRAAIVVAACVGSIESPGTISEGISITYTAARKITTAYTIGSARTKTAATGAIRASDASDAVSETGISREVAETTTRGRLTGELSTLSRNLLPGTGLTLGSESPRALPPNRSAVARLG
jgi:hypothetical protein